MLAPIKIASQQESSSLRSQPHYTSKLPIRSRKLHFHDLHQHKTIHKDEDQTYSYHVPSPDNSREDKLQSNRLNKYFIF
jgi:hypothetical protein